jgi:hypothetical protein
LNGSLASGISTQVNIQGENWEWGSSEENQTSYKLNAVSVIGEGSFQNGIATLLPLRIQSGDSVIPTLAALVATHNRVSSGWKKSPSTNCNSLCKEFLIYRQRCLVLRDC